MKRLFIPLFFALGLSPLCFANYYERGRRICKDFNDMRQKHEREPESKALKTGYAKCLILKGGEGELRGLNMLDHLTKYGNEVYAAFFLAEYISTGGAFERRADQDKIDEAIEAYFKVLQLINNDPFYPYRGGDIVHEINEQTELASYYAVPLLYMYKFGAGAEGSYRWALLSSPSYDGERDLNTYQKYSRYTVDSLKKAVEYADLCLNLPNKDHFITDIYEAYKQACQIIKDNGSALLPMERQRLALLADESCGGDLPQCGEYYELESEIREIYLPIKDSLIEIFVNTFRAVIPPALP